MVKVWADAVVASTAAHTSPKTKGAYSFSEKYGTPDYVRFVVWNLMPTPEPSQYHLELIFKSTRKVPNTTPAGRNWVPP